MSSGELSQPTQTLERETQLVAYKKKIRRYRVCAAGMAVLFAALLAAMLFLGWLTVQDMRRQASPKAYSVEEGVCNLTASEVVTTTTEAGRFILYTNYKQIAVSFPDGNGGDGRVVLQNTNGDELQVCQLTPSTDRCVFANLTSAQRYRVVCEEMPEMEIIISEGRVVSFWSSLKSVLGELGMLI